jgi:hypothetical protein
MLLRISYQSVSFGYHGSSPGDFRSGKPNPSMVSTLRNFSERVCSEFGWWERASLSEIKP